MGNPDTYDTGERLRQIAVELYGGNQSELARALGMKPPSFSKYVQGNRRPGATVLERLTRLGVDLHWFLTGEGSPMHGSTSPETPLSVGTSLSPAQFEGPEGTLHRVPLVQVTADEDGNPQLDEISTAAWLAPDFVQQNYGVPAAQLKEFRITGNAMVDTIQPGNRVRGALWSGECLTEGAIYLFHGTSGLIARRVRVSSESLLLVADHPDVPNLSFDASTWTDRLLPIARILEVVRPL